MGGEPEPCLASRSNFGVTRPHTLPKGDGNMKRIIIDEEFKALIPPLSEEERELLEGSIVADGCRDPLVLWGGILIDGHHRHEICTRLGIEFDTVEMSNLETRNDAMMWVIRNQLGRRNLSNYQRAELVLKLKPAIAEKAKENVAAGGGSGISGRQKSDNPIDTKNELAKASGLSHDTISKADFIGKNANEYTKKALRAGETSINREYSRIKRDTKRAEIIEQLDNIEAKEAKAIEGVYDVIVIDPPWPMKKIERDVTPNQVEFDYPTMSLEEIAKLEVPCADSCHVWLWTTHKFMPAALSLLDGWGMSYVCAFVWHKPGGFQPFGLPQYNSEFALYARSGTPTFIDTKAFPVCFNAPRGAHSEKPGEFYSMIERVTAGRRLDMFGRRKISGFDSWGKEA